MKKIEKYFGKPVYSLKLDKNQHWSIVEDEVINIKKNDSTFILYTRTLAPFDVKYINKEHYFTSKQKAEKRIVELNAL